MSAVLDSTIVGVHKPQTYVALALDMTVCSCCSGTIVDAENVSGIDLQASDYYRLSQLAHHRAANAHLMEPIPSVDL